MLATYQRFGVIDLAGTLLLGLLHATMAVAYAVPALGRGVYAPTPGRVSVVSYIDGYGPAWQVLFGLTALGMFAALRWTRHLPVAHSLGAGVLAIYAAALWAGVTFSSPAPSIVPAVLATVLVGFHAMLVLTYNAALQVPRRRPRGAGR